MSTTACKTGDGGRIHRVGYIGQCPKHARVLGQCNCLFNRVADVYCRSNVEACRTDDGVGYKRQCTVRFKLVINN